jgi:hypothetical protein
MEVWRAASRLAHGRARGRNIWKFGAQQAAWRVKEHMSGIYGSRARGKPHGAIEEHVAEIYGSLARGKPRGAWKNTWQKYMEVGRAASRMAHGRTRGRTIWK